MDNNYAGELTLPEEDYFESMEGINGFLHQNLSKQLVGAQDFINLSVIRHGNTIDIHHVLGNGGVHGSVHARTRSISLRTEDESKQDVMTRLREALHIDSHHDGFAKANAISGTSAGFLEIGTSDDGPLSIIDFIGSN